ncbi:MAG: TIGR00730 family Rossman fold protein [Parcubacteria group bacterium]
MLKKTTRPKPSTKEMREGKFNLPASKLQLIEEDAPTRDFRSSFHWRVFRIMAEFVDGWQFLADFKRSVTFFGSARFKPESPWYQQARELASKLADDGFDVITGGGPGIMEAANQGAHESHTNSLGLIEDDRRGDSRGDSIGLNIRLPFEQRINKYVEKAVAFHYFFVRKVMLTYYAQAYIYFPGGFGTLDEAFEVITLVQTKKIPRIPIVFVGKGYWGKLDDFMKNTVYGEYKAIDKGDMDIYTIVDTVEDAYKIIKKSPPRKVF